MISKKHTHCYCTSIFAVILLEFFGYFLGHILDNTFFSCKPTSLLHLKYHYQLITSLFMHNDLHHLLTNMVFLLILAILSRKIYLHKSLVRIFLLIGYLSNIMVCLFSLISKSNFILIGCSGALFGLFSLLLLNNLVNKNIPFIVKTTLLLLSFFLLYTGYLSSTYTFMAHLSGFILGIPIFFIQSTYEHSSL